LSRKEVKVTGMATASNMTVQFAPMTRWKLFSVSNEL
jgi:hypothetical protein